VVDSAFGVGGQIVFCVRAVAICFMHFFLICSGCRKLLFFGTFVECVFSTRLACVRSVMNHDGSELVFGSDDMFKTDNCSW